MPIRKTFYLVTRTRDGTNTMYRSEKVTVVTSSGLKRAMRRRDVTVLTPCEEIDNRSFKRSGIAVSVGDTKAAFRAVCAKPKGDFLYA